MPANSGWSRLTSIVFQPICGIFSAGSAGSISLTSPAIQPKPARHGLFQPALGHQLHADADAEERPRRWRRPFLDRLDHARHGVEPGAAVGIGADARQHDAVGGAHALGIGGQVDLGR